METKDRTSLHAKCAPAKTMNGCVTTTVVTQQNVKKAISVWRRTAATNVFVRTSVGIAPQTTAWRNVSQAMRPYRNANSAVVQAVNGTVKIHVLSLDAWRAKPRTMKRTAKRVNVPTENGSAL